MNDITIAKIVELEREYIRDVGIGQFSYYRFAHHIIDNEPALTERIMAEALRKILGQQTDTALDNAGPGEVK